MDVMTDDSGTAAVKVDQDLLDARAACDRLGINYHWKNKVPSLMRMLRAAEKKANPMMTVAKDADVTATVDANTITVSSGGNNQVIPRTIPPDVEVALQYMASYKKANERLVRNFIESLL
jgi:hypothetical protein